MVPLSYLKWYQCYRGDYVWDVPLQKLCALRTHRKGRMGNGRQRRLCRGGGVPLQKLTQFCCFAHKKSFSKKTPSVDTWEETKIKS